MLRECLPYTWLPSLSVVFLTEAHDPAYRVIDAHAATDSSLTTVPLFPVDTSPRQRQPGHGEPGSRGSGRTPLLQPSLAGWKPVSRRSRPELRFYFD